MSAEPAFLAILGPTASGKTDLSLAVAERLDAEIISMDSRQIFIGMDIGTAKVDAEARARVPHHGIDLVHPNERYSAGRFARDARRWIEEITGRGRVPLLVGGTGFFLKGLMEPLFSEPDLDAERVDALRAWLRALDAGELQRWVHRLDPERADLAIEGGPQRTIRTLEVALLAGVPLSTLHREAPPPEPGVSGVVVVLDLPREENDRRIDERVARLVESGWVEEVRGLLADGYGPEDHAMTGHGYREITAYLHGDMTLEEAMGQIARATRSYSRRQRTWFRNQLPATHHVIDAMAPLEEQVDDTLEAWNAERARTAEGVVR